MDKITNAEDGLKQVKHDIKIGINRLLKDCEQAEIPIFLTYYLPGVGYVYHGLFPEEMQSEQLQSEYGRFSEFLKTCISFNKEDYKPVIKINSSRQDTAEERE